MGHLMFSKSFWKGAAERAIRTFCQTLVAVAGAAQFDWMSANWQSLLVTSGVAAGLSVLTSIASMNVGDRGTPSMVESVSTVVNMSTPKPEGL